MRFPWPPSLIAVNHCICMLLKRSSTCFEVLLSPLQGCRASTDSAMRLTCHAYQLL